MKSVYTHEKKENKISAKVYQFQSARNAHFLYNIYINNETYIKLLVTVSISLHRSLVPIILQNKVIARKREREKKI